MTSHDLSFTISEIRSAHLAFPDTPGYWEQYRRQNEEVSVAPEIARYEFKPGWQTVYATMVETPLVRVELADGNVGWGESNTPIAPEIVCVMLDAAIAEMVIGREFANPTALWDFVYDSQRGRGINSGYWMDALAALDIAVWDAIGKRNDVPVAALLHSGFRSNIPVYLSGLRRATLDERITQAKSLADQGVLGAKIFQSGDIAAAIEELDALIQGAPNVQQWMVDTLWMCTLEDAINAKREFGERNLRFFECPLQPEDIAGHRALHRAEGSPIAIGEHFRTTYQLNDWLNPSPIFDVYQPDIGRTSISDFIRQRDAAYGVNVPVTPHMGNGVSVFQAATLQCAAVSSPATPTRVPRRTVESLARRVRYRLATNRRLVHSSGSTRSRCGHRRIRHRTVHRTQTVTKHDESLVRIVAICNYSCDLTTHTYNQRNRLNHLRHSQHHPPDHRLHRFTSVAERMKQGPQRVSPARGIFAQLPSFRRRPESRGAGQRGVTLNLVVRGPLQRLCKGPARGGNVRRTKGHRAFAQNPLWAPSARHGYQIVMTTIIPLSSGILCKTSIVPAKTSRLRDGTSIQRGGATGMRRSFDLNPDDLTSFAKGLITL